MKIFIYLILVSSCLIQADDLELLGILPSNFEYTEISFYDLDKLNESEEFRYTWKTFYQHHYPPVIGDMMPESRQILEANFHIKGIPHNSKVKKLTKEEKEDYGVEYASFTMGTGRLYLLTFRDSQKFIRKKLASGFVESNLSDSFSKVYEKREKRIVDYLLYDISREIFVSSNSRREIEEIQNVIAGNSISIMLEEDNEVVKAIRYATADSRSNSAFRFINPLIWKRNSLKQQLKEQLTTEEEGKEELRKYEFEHQILVRVPIYSVRSRVDHVYYYIGKGEGKDSGKSYKQFLSDMKGSGKISRSGSWAKVIHPKFELLKDSEQEKAKLKPGAERRE